MTTTVIHSTRPFDFYWADLRRRALRLSVAIAAAVGEMPFLEHLEELRSRIIKALIALGASFAVCWYFCLELFDFVAKPITRIAGVSLVINDPTEAFTVYLKVSFVAALYLSAPFVLWQAWRFIAPALYKHEKRYAGPFIISTSLFFLLGGIFGYTVAFPMALQFLMDMAKQGHMVPLIAAERYFGLFSTVMIVLGVVFEIPPVVFILSRIGIVTGPFLLRNTQWAIFISTVVAAVVTPTTDAFNMMVVAVPMILLYLIGVVVAYVFGRQRRATETGA
jgi:sec-independent protein translocase protein TatC